jgi:hypothetical protein
VKATAESIASAMIREGKITAGGFTVTLDEDWWLSVTFAPTGSMNMKIPRPNSMDFMEDSIKIP